jgi:hypothetical protein
MPASTANLARSATNFCLRPQLMILIWAQLPGAHVAG